MVTYVTLGSMTFVIDEITIAEYNPHLEIFENPEPALVPA